MDDWKLSKPLKLNKHFDKETVGVVNDGVLDNDLRVLRAYPRHVITERDMVCPYQALEGLRIKTITEQGRRDTFIIITVLS